MSGKLRVMLDRVGDATPPNQFTVVDSEVGFLKYALAETPIVLRGSSLCRWAEVFYSGRNVEFSVLESPSAYLQSMCPGLTVRQATWIVASTPQLWNNLAPAASVQDVLKALLPDGPWVSGTNRLQHAASWLLWLSEAEIPDGVHPLVTFQAVQWEQSSQGPERLAYSALDAEKANNLVLEWIGLKPSDSFLDISFPVHIPQTWIERLRENWAYEVIQRGLSLFEELARREVPRQVMECAAEETFEYLCSHTDELDQRAIELLSPFLPTDSVNHLRKLLPPEDPGDVPANVDEVIAWFETCYLPYRSWEVAFGDNQAHELVSRLARQFSEWYLNFYASALCGGNGKSHLVISKSAALLNDQSEDVILWLILDGLSTKDASELVHLVQISCPKLSVQHYSIVYSTIPTITEFAKQSLLTGLPPALAPDSRGSGTFTLLSEGKDPSTHLKQAEKGYRVAWLIPEPDRTYHKTFDPTIIGIQVKGELQTIADQICRAVDSTPDYLTLRIVISTDHGRLFSKDTRSHAVPEGMTAHGRAAWGTARVCFTAEGIFIGDDSPIAYLCRKRFNLPEDCAIALDAASFEKSDGSGGTDQFAHGGAYPEEVLIPWIEMCRDVISPKLRVAAKGKARPGKAGTLTLSFDNASVRSLLICGLYLRFGSDRVVELSLDFTIKAKEHIDAKVSLDNWPIKADAALATGAVSFILIGGQKHEVPVQVEIDVEEMYSRDFSLEDL